MNILHRLGDALERATARIRFAWDCLTGAMPLPTPLERLTVMSILSRLAALEAAAAAQGDTAGIAATAAQAAQDATRAVVEMGDRVAKIEAEIGTDAVPAAPAAQAVDTSGEVPA